MLDNIKSFYFIKIIFSFVNEKEKLKIIKYNKNLQNKINISIINYKFYKGKYIIYESKGIEKEYKGFIEEDSFIFEGEYWNGERYGKGKEFFWYDIDLIEFEGEYKNGKRNGFGKEYYYNGNLQFEAEYLNNKEFKGIKYDINGNIIYILNNNINGIRKEYNDDGKLLFEGEYINGKGKEYFEDNILKFEGEYLNDKKIKEKDMIHWIIKYMN